jgi:hypothetical protein
MKTSHRPSALTERPAIRHAAHEALLTLLLIALCVAASACGGGGNVTGPSSPSQPGYAGHWNGMTSQGASIAITVSSDQRVTSITVGYRFNGCSGSKTFPNLSLETARPQPPPGNPQVPAPFDNPRFAYESAPDLLTYTLVSGAFTSSETANGAVFFTDYSGCGHAHAIWNATKG